MKILMAFDSFKETLSSVEAGEIASKAAREHGFDTEVMCVSDGGEGLTEAFIHARNGNIVTVDTVDPLMNKIIASFAISGDTIVIECASAAGLALVPPEKRDPCLTSTYGFGLMIKKALEMGGRNFVLGLGGSATNDAGAGMAAALGVTFKKADGSSFIPVGSTLTQISVIDSTANIQPELKNARFVGCCDVTNPLCGKNGASHIYAPQKGATPEAVELLEKNMKCYASFLGKDIAEYPGSGAAGGLGSAVLFYLNGKLARGFDTVAELIGLEEKIAGADIVFTGEGRTDSQTENGKLPAGVAGLCAKHGKPCYIISGAVSGTPDIKGATGIFATTDIPGLPPKDVAERRLYDTVNKVLMILGK